MAQAADFLVLVVDDEEDIRVFLRTALEDAGFRVETASNGREALEAVKRTRPDFVSLDLVMPGGSGIAFLYELRRNRAWRMIPVMVITGHARDELGRADLQSALDGKHLSGPNAYLEKPVTAEKYLAAVCQTLGVPPPAPPMAEPGAEALRTEVAERLQNASPGQLEEILRLLQERAGGSAGAGKGAGGGGKKGT